MLSICGKDGMILFSFGILRFSDKISEEKNNDIRVFSKMFANLENFCM